LYYFDGNAIGTEFISILTLKGQNFPAPRRDRTADWKRWNEQQ